MWTRLIRTFATPLRKQPKRPSHAVIETAIFRCWNAECESLYRTFLQSPQGDDSDLAATALLAKLDRKRRNRWSEAVRSCPVSANAIASQLVRNGRYEAVDRKSSRLVSKEVSDLWRTITSDPVDISEKFTQREFTAGLQHLKPGKVLGSDSICPELIIHAEAVLKSWLWDFLSSCMLRLKIFKIWRRALVVAIPKPMKSVEYPKSYCHTSFAIILTLQTYS